MTFEDFLRDQHAKEYAGTDDDMADDYEKWLAALTDNEWKRFASLWGRS